MVEILLKDGRIAHVDFLRKSDSTRDMLDYINELITEGADIKMDTLQTIDAEKKWKAERLRNQKEKTGYILIAKIDGKIIGTSGAYRGIGKERDNVTLGIALRKEARGIGLGEILLKTNMEIAKKMFRPKNLYLNVYAKNRIARRLYRKLGFRQFARFKNWIKDGNGYGDMIWMIKEPL